jgi:hypothetical protein
MKQNENQKNSSWWDSITFKDVVMATGGLCTMICHYFLTQISIHDSISEIRGDIKVLNVRVNMMEASRKQTADNSYNFNTEAILPENKLKLR